MAYTPTYEATDMSAIIIDLIASIGAEWVGFVALIALLMLGVWAMSKTKKIGRV